MRALAADASSVRATGLKAGVLMVRGPGKDKVSQLMTVLDSVVEKGTGPAHFMYGVLALYGELGAALESELDGAIQLEKLLGRHKDPAGRFGERDEWLEACLLEAGDDEVKRGACMA